MFWVLFVSMLWSSVSGLTEYHRIRDRALFRQDNEQYEYHSQQWHRLEFAEKTLGIGTGVAIAFDAIDEKSILVGISDLFMVGAMNWNVRDGVYNMKNGNEFYYRSPNTTSSIEQFGTPLIKITFLVSAVIINLIIRGL